LKLSGVELRVIHQSHEKIIRLQKFKLYKFEDRSLNELINELMGWCNGRCFNWYLLNTITPIRCLVMWMDWYWWKASHRSYSRHQTSRLHYPIALTRYLLIDQLNNYVKKAVKTVLKFNLKALCHETQGRLSTPVNSGPWTGSKLTWLTNMLRPLLWLGSGKKVEIRLNVQKLHTEVWKNGHLEDLKNWVS